MLTLGEFLWVSVCGIANGQSAQIPVVESAVEVHGWDPDTAILGGSPP